MLIIVQYIFSVLKIYSIDTKDLTCSKGVFLHKVSIHFLHRSCFKPMFVDFKFSGSEIQGKIQFSVLCF